MQSIHNRSCIFIQTRYCEEPPKFNFFHPKVPYSTLPYPILPYYRVRHRVLLDGPSSQDECCHQQCVTRQAEAAAASCSQQPETKELLIN